MSKRHKPDKFMYEEGARHTPPPGRDTPCGKKGYPDAATADRVREHQEEVSGDKLDTYFCDDCGKWHLTSRTW